MAVESPWPLSTNPPADETERGVGVSLDEFPLIRALLETHGDPLRNELLEFAHTVHYQRAPRVRRNLVARLYVDDPTPEVAVVRDLSESGVRLWVAGERAFDAGRPEPFILQVKVPGSRRYVSMSARLVRVVQHGAKRGVELAFQFTSPLEAEVMRDLLSRVRQESASTADGA